MLPALHHYSTHYSSAQKAHMVLDREDDTVEGLQLRQMFCCQRLECDRCTACTLLCSTLEVLGHDVT